MVARRWNWSQLRVFRSRDKGCFPVKYIVGPNPIRLLLELPPHCHRKSAIWHSDACDKSTLLAERPIPVGAGWSQWKTDTSQKCQVVNFPTVWEGFLRLGEGLREGAGLGGGRNTGNIRRWLGVAADATTESYPLPGCRDQHESPWFCTC